MDIRTIHISKTLADVAAMPLGEQEVGLALVMQKLGPRVERIFGKIGYDLIVPCLTHDKDSFFRFPKYELIIAIFGRPNLLVVYKDQAECTEQTVVDAYKKLKEQQDGTSNLNPAILEV